MTNLKTYLKSLKDKNAQLETKANIKRVESENLKGRQTDVMQFFIETN